MAFGEVLKTTPILVNGLSQKLTDMVFILGKMEIDMRAHGKTVLNMDKELINIIQEIAIRESIKLENHMGKVSTFGEMVKYILVNFEKDLNTAKGNGVLTGPRLLQDMKVSTKMISNMDKVVLFGSQAIFIKGSISLMKEMGMVKCNGMMDQST